MRGREKERVNEKEKSIKESYNRAVKNKKNRTSTRPFILDQTMQYHSICISVYCWTNES